MPTPQPPGTVQVATGTPTRPTPDFIITSSAQFTNANCNNPAYRVIAVAPGVALAGTITLTASGTPSAPRWLRLNRSDNAHPANLTNAETAAVAVLNITGSNWIIDRISIRNANGISNWSGTNNTFQFGVFDTRIGSGNGLKLSLAGTNHTILNSVFRNPLLTPGVDSYAIYFNGGSGSKIIGNEFIGLPSGVQVGPGTGGNFIVSSNEFYQSSASFTDCNGVLTPSGNCMAGEGVAFVAKGSGTAQSYIENNFIWDYPPSDEALSGSGAGGTQPINLGSANRQTDNFTVRNNTIVGKATGAGKPTYGIYTALNVANNTISENYIANFANGFSAAYIKNSTLTNNVYSNNTNNYLTSAQATGNTVSPANAGRAAVAGERKVVKYHLTNPTPVSYP